MGRRSAGLIKKLEKKVMKRLGQDIVYRRRLVDNNTSELDRYGEPIDRSGNDLEESTVRIVVISIALDETLTSIGGLSDQKKEKLKCYISQSVDVQIGDQIFFPYSVNKVYEISMLKPSVFQDDFVIWEVEALRDATTH